MLENPEVQDVEDTEQPISVQLQKSSTGTLPDNDIQGESTCSDDIINTPAASSLPANAAEMGNRNKPEADLSMMPEARSQLYYRPNNQMNSYLPAARRFSGVPFSPYSTNSTAQSMSNYEALYGSMNTVRSPNDLKTYTQYSSQDTHSYIGRYCPPSMVAGATLYARNFYPSTNEHYRNEQMAGRMAYDRRFHHRAVPETPASVLGGL
jgi:hypothetical protein